MASITFRKVVKHYEGVPAATVKGIDLHIKDKEFVVLVGPSGCGKSTSLRMIAGLEDITSGEILIGDTVVNHLPPKDRDIAMVFQNYALYPHMNVRENMSFGLQLRHFPQAEIDKRVNEAAAILGLANLLDRLPKQLSGGQRQRVALGRAIVREPKVFLMDEPLSNLDAKLRVQMRAEIKKLHQRLQTTFVYVTHDQVEAMTMADRIVLLHNGVIQQYDEPGIIYARPANTFVATFIGSPPMNLLKVTRTDQGLQLPGKDGGPSLTWTVPLAELFTTPLASDALILGIRPEHILVNPPAGAPPSLAVPCRVDLIEPMGAETYLYLTALGHTINARVDPTVKVEVGQECTAHIPLSRFHLFDEKTTDRLPRRDDH
ncbi:MAG: carbohydrate ABC transporter ATP-binding protein [Candidatus Ozemobacter sibiricus]|uniref:Carbohydrate ABC transporter ATP-binding protein n=1 Tax=Candidatus Ozemobacter sibiricus TaxID=2268124 RepID=A0A367ZV21_9BACT|nr:MAG: carbohydrate ABC transporter ATP-binding protein [Candidatus Ozemobacter sibiricus]